MEGVVMRQFYCTNCKQFSWINTAMCNSVIVGELCENCWDLVIHDSSQSSARVGKRGYSRLKICPSNSPGTEDAGFSNAVRHYEEDW